MRGHLEMKEILEQLESEYNPSEMELFRIFFEEYKENKLLLGATKRLNDGYDRYMEIRNGD